MLKKLSCFTFIFLLYMVAVDCVSTSATGPSLVPVNVFCKIYYGTLSKEGDKTVFTPAPGENSNFTIEGTWKSSSFSGACTIVYQDGSTKDVTYKKSRITGQVTDRQADGITQVYTCQKGRPRGRIDIYTSDGATKTADWFFFSAPIRALTAQAASVSYASLCSSPYDYVDLPVKVRGTLKGVYARKNTRYLKVADADGNLFLFRYEDTMTSRQCADVENVAVGDSIEICGTMEQMRNLSEKPIHFFTCTLGYETDFQTLQPYFSDDKLFKAVQPFSVTSDPELAGTVPILHAFYCRAQGHPTDASSLADSYENICQYPLAFTGTKAALSGTVLYDTYEEDSSTAYALLEEDDTQNLYLVSWEASQDADLQNHHITIDGTRSGNRKLSYFYPASRTAGYAVYPHIRSSVPLEDAASDSQR